MSSVTPIDSRHPPRPPGGERTDDRTFVACDLVAAMDDRSRRLLSRSDLERRLRLVPRALMLADLLALSCSYLVATLLWGSAGALGSTRELIVFCATLPLWLAVARVHGLYRADQQHADHSTADDVVGVFHLVTIGVWLLVVCFRLVGRTSPGTLALITFWAAAIIWLPVARTVARRLCRRSRAYIQNTLILGAGEVGQLIARKLVRHPEYGLNVVGFIDREPKARRTDLPEHLAILGGPERLAEVVKTLDVERVIVAFSREPEPELLVLLRQLRAFPVQIDLVPRLFELVGPRVTVHAVEGLALLGLPPCHRSTLARATKRAIDVVVATLALVVLSPLLAYIALRISLDSDGPVLFRQTRLGASMKEFTALKFRTMRADTDPGAHRSAVRQSIISGAQATTEGGMYKLERADAITGFGRRLRRSSLDELPQLINVLRGEMSLVGPRPCIPYEVESFQPHHLERFSVPQGITGLWQVTARANCSFGEALEMDVAYVRGWSLWLDLRLLLQTPLQVIRQRTATT
jgi:exopolysaccharide biosynthesis polyprenyl glycosylphosphotransferase